MMNNISIICLKEGCFSGVFRLRQPAYCQTQVGQPYLRLRLEDMSGSLPAYIWREHLYRNLSVQDMSCVYVEGKIRKRSDGTVVDLSSISPSEKYGVVRLIPHSLCPEPWLMSVLDAAVSRITIGPLSAFVQSVLADDSIAFPFVSVPASLNHHHSFPGGLLAHSLECFQIVAKHREFPRDQFELGLVAALFHDVGKILTMTHEMKRTTLGSNMSHDKLTLEILSPHLRRLDSQWADGATELRYLLTWKKGQQIPKYDMADLVTCSDRLSAGLERQRRGGR